MEFAMLNAVWAGAAVKPFPPIANALPANMPFDGVDALGVNVAINPLPYQQVTVAPTSFLWDAITVGYCSVPAIAMLPGLPSPALAKELRRTAAARANYLAAAFVLPWTTVGPRRRPSYQFIEATEKVVLSFLLGQAIALRQAKLIWGPMYGVRRLYHRSLYSGIPGLPITSGPSPDYVCEASVVGVRSLGVVEAKGRGRLFDPNVTQNDRDQLNSWFLQWNGIGLTPSIGAVSLAATGSPFGIEQIVGQFWDPPFNRAWEMPSEVGDALLARYFLRLRAFLAAFGEPRRRAGMRGPQRITWNCEEIGFSVGMSEKQYNALEELALEPRGEAKFRLFLQGQRIGADTQVGLGRPTVRNSDGLYLTSLNTDIGEQD